MAGMTGQLQSRSTALPSTVSQHMSDRELRVTELAQRVGIGVPYMSLIMNGKRTPNLHIAAKIAKAMGVTLDEFYSRLNEKIAESIAV